MTTPIASLAMITLDCAEVGAMKEFYGALLGWEVTYADDNVAMLTGPATRLGIGVIPDYQAPVWPDHGGKQFHLDLAVDGDLDEAARQCVDLGATRPDEQPGETWRVLLDPAGHPFCLTQAANW